MGRHILQRLFLLLPILLGVSLISFLLITLAPGDFLTTMSMNPAVSPDRIAKMRTEFGLDQPWYVQYGLWLYRLSPYEFPLGMKWPDLGYSFSNRMPVFTLLSERFLNTLVLSFTAQSLIWILAIPLGVFLVQRSGTWMDWFTSGFLFLGISFPQILLSLLALLFAARTGWFPIGGMNRLDAEMMPFWYRFGDFLHHLALPAGVLAFTEIAVLVRYARGGMMDTLSAEFIRTARAKGVSEKDIMKKHVLPNSINPLLTLFGLSFANLLSASFLVEIVMGWPGLGKLAYDAMLAQDLYVLMASLTAGTILLVTGNLIADLLLALFDPRIRYE